MPSYDVAHINEQGSDMIIIPLDDSFGNKSEAGKDGIINELQARASAAGLRGSVVVVWGSGSGPMQFISPRPWVEFFKSIDWNFVARNINKTLSW